MTQYLNLGGQLIDLYADYEYARGGDTASDYRTVSKLLKTTQVIANKATLKKGRYETFGGVIGTGVGIYYGAVTLPVAALDGPLPIFDLAWAYSTARFTKKAMEVGSKIGKQFD